MLPTCLLQLTKQRPHKEYHHKACVTPFQQGPTRSTASVAILTPFLLTVCVHVVLITSAREYSCTLLIGHLDFPCTLTKRRVDTCLSNEVMTWVLGGTYF